LTPTTQYIGRAPPARATLVLAIGHTLQTYLRVTRVAQRPIFMSRNSVYSQKTPITTLLAQHIGNFKDFNTRC
jgi:hypothetical protein